MKASEIIAAWQKGRSIKLGALSGVEFKRLLIELDAIRYP